MGPLRKNIKSKLPIPEPIRGSEPGSFAQQTVTVRFLDILQRVIQGSDWPLETMIALQALLAEIPFSSLRPLQESEAPDVEDWERYLKPYQGLNWLQVPWFMSETYFFRTILETTGYFRSGPTKCLDPFSDQKLEGLDDVLEAIQPLCAQLNQQLALAHITTEHIQTTLKSILHTAIWSNQADLSVWSAGDKAQPERPQGDAGSDFLLVDDASTVANYLILASKPTFRVDFVLDNFGLELAYDLVLTDYLLASGLAGQVRYHAKPFPVFVSDSTLEDIHAMINLFQESLEKSVSEMGNRLANYHASGKLTLKDHIFWTSPLSAWEMPSDLYSELNESGLIISKGDLNYRRWLGDRHWAFDTPVEKVLAYAPAPWLALRVNKAEIIVGLRPGKAEELDRKDPQWLHDGKWAVIQFVDPAQTD